MAVRTGLAALLAAGALTTAAFCFAPAAQAATYDFNALTAPGDPEPGSVNLVITTGGAAGSSGGVFVESVTGNVLGSAVELAVGSGTDTPPSFLTSSDGEWWYDNVLYPTLNSPYGTAFDNPGLLLEYKVAGTLINIFSPGNTSGDPYVLGQSPNQQQEDLALTSGTLSQTPLPSTWTMLLAGFAALGFFAFRGSKKSSTIGAA